MKTNGLDEYGVSFNRINNNNSGYVFRVTYAGVRLIMNHLGTDCKPVYCEQPLVFSNLYSYSVITGAFSVAFPFQFAGFYQFSKSTLNGTDTERRA